MRNQLKGGRGSLEGESPGTDKGARAHTQKRGSPPPSAFQLVIKIVEVRKCISDILGVGH